jgi:hypothetical protein
MSTEIRAIEDCYDHGDLMDRMHGLEARIAALERSYRHSYCESRTAPGCAVCGFEINDPLHKPRSAPETEGK